MKFDVNKLPNDPQLLKQLLLRIRQEQKGQYDERMEQEEQLREQLKEERFRYQLLEEKYLTLQRRFFGRRSEKFSQEEHDQMRLFNEAEVETERIEQEEDQGATEEIVVTGHTRKKGGRRRLPADLPREEIIHDLREEEKLCPCCHKQRPCIGKDEREELDIVPARIKVLKHIRLKYGPCSCAGFADREEPEVLTAPQPGRMIPQSIVSPGLLAYVITSKFVDSLPFYRQSKMFERIAVDLSRATLCNWALLAAERCKPLLECMRQEIRSGPLIQMDETTVQVLKEEGRDPTSTSYMWVAVGYSDGRKPLMLFAYHATRSQTVPLEFLEGYEGYVQTDGYSGYNSACSQSGIIHVGCFAHARRYFYDALKLSKKSKSAHKGLSYIQKLYAIERALREKDMSPERFVEERGKEALPVLREFHAWLEEKSIYINPESKAGKAVQYTLKEWNKLIRYLEAPFLTPDNNRVENAIRPFVVGRKNWLFSNTAKGAESSAVLYSLVESAKANNLEPYHYLRYLFTKLPTCASDDELKQLLPTKVTKDNLLSV